MDIENRTFEAVYTAYEEQLLLKNFALATRKTYLSNFKRYYQWTSEEVARPYDQEVVHSYLLYGVRRGVKWQTMNSIFCLIGEPIAQSVLPFDKRIIRLYTFMLAINTAA